MAGFMSPSILFLNTWDSAERIYMQGLLPKLKRAGYTDYHEPAVGGFAMPIVAVEAGWLPQNMTTSDTHLFTGILGELCAGRDMSRLGITLDGAPIQFESDEPIDQAAEALYVQYLARMEKSEETAYFAALSEDLRDNRDHHMKSFREQVAGVHARLKGLTFRTESVWEHMNRVADNPNAVIISNPPTYKGAYEKFFDTKGRLDWNQPDYDIFDAPVDIPRMVEFMEGKKALLIVQQQQDHGNSAHEKPVYARQLSAGDLVYINSNRPEEVIQLVGGLRVVRRKMAPRGERLWPMIPPDYEITEKSQIGVFPVEAKVADAYRDEWMHRLYPISGSDNVMVTVDGYAAGVMGYSLQSISNSFSLKWADYATLRFAFGAKHDTLRLTRLATMIALRKETIKLNASPASTIAIESSIGLLTVEMTRHPEAKGLRSLMKMQDRQKHPDGFKLVYTAEWTQNEPVPDTLARFLKMERQYQKSVKNSQKGNKK